MKMTPFEHNGLSLLLRDGPTRPSEEDIVREVQREYPWDFAFETALDIGAHVGAWTLQAKRVNPKARIVAAELDPHTYLILQANTQLLSHVESVHARVGYASGLFTIARNLRNSGSTFAFPSVGGDKHLNLTNHETLPAPDTLTLGEIMMRWQMPRVDVLKLDCEGSEVEILVGVTDDVLARIGRVIGEIHTSPDDFEAHTGKRLQGAGFHVEYRPHPGDPNLFYIHAWRNQ